MGMSTLAVKPEGRRLPALLQLMREKLRAFNQSDTRLATGYSGRRSRTGLPASSSQRYQPAAVTLDTAGKLKLKKDCVHDCRRGAREPDEVVDGYRGWSKQADNLRSLFGTRVGRRGSLLRLLDEKLCGRSKNWSQNRDHVIDVCEHGRTPLEQLVAALRTWIERRSGYGEDFTALLEGKTGSDEGARSFRRFNDHHAGGQA